ncbi:hypothetical protein EYF80_030968 [Liparis tanakae]|uniref:Uncharacterized protein n=1 Tax=Liparis tanakae TaxID=230148 RepID=A0A4Z2GZB0_9TELE|nr:hypothetical protein EYF80_030968 [Liparis tanakae]
MLCGALLPSTGQRYIAFDFSFRMSSNQWEQRASANQRRSRAGLTFERRDKMTVWIRDGVYFLWDLEGGGPRTMKSTIVRP